MVGGLNGISSALSTRAGGVGRILLLGSALFGCVVISRKWQAAAKQKNFLVFGMADIAPFAGSHHARVGLAGTQVGSDGEDGQPMAWPQYWLTL